MTDERQLIAFENRREWRSWLESQHDHATEVWLTIYKKGTRKQNLSLDDAVEEALCFGWIDGKLVSLDAERYSLRFTPRKANSVWSIRNIKRIEKLIEEGLMTEAGMEKVNAARRNGQWDAAINREQIDRIPEDLDEALRRRKGSMTGFNELTNSRRKQLLHWLFTAKRSETRQNRIKAIVQEASKRIATE